MKIVLSSIGKFHTFDLARELFRHKVLDGIYTGYPGFKLRNENITSSLIHPYPYFHAPYMKFPFWDIAGNWAKQEWEYWDRVSFDRYVAKNIPFCNVFSGLSGSALKTGRTVKARGGVYICDRGSSHIRVQDYILEEEHARWGLPYRPIDPRIVEREEAEYELADAITVPSSFVYRSFVDCGVPSEKLQLIPYGVDLERFQKVAEPASGRFDVLFVGGGSLRKGVADLLQAYAKLVHPRKSLTLAGTFSPSFSKWLRSLNLLSDDIKLIGHMPQTRLKQLMSCSHVMVLPSIEEGLAMVQAQALACGCPVIATKNTGAEDLYSDGQEGFIVPIRQPNLIAEKLQYLADQPEIRQKMSLSALAKVRDMGGWESYGNKTFSLMKKMSAARVGGFSQEK